MVRGYGERMGDGGEKMETNRVRENHQIAFASRRDVAGSRPSTASSTLFPPVRERTAWSRRSRATPLIRLLAAFSSTRVRTEVTELRHPSTSPAFVSVSPLSSQIVNHVAPTNSQYQAHIVPRRRRKLDKFMFHENRL